MEPSSLDPSTLTSFADAAAGHAGVLSDPTGTLIIKPCTPAEIAFYESTAASHPALVPFLPRFMGKLQLAATDPSTSDHAGAQPALGSTAATLAPSDPGPLKGKKLDTDLHIVLENVAAGFSRPNILDLKLGARLWDDAAPGAKRARLDAVSGATTSGSLGFRIAGMRVWQGLGRGGVEAGRGMPDSMALEGDTLVYNKLYGRQFTAESVVEGFMQYLVVPGAGVDAGLARRITRNFLDDVRAIERILAAEESRMYSSSILLVYEGDGQAYLEKEKAMNAAPARAQFDADADEDENGEGEGDLEEDEEEDDEEEEKRVFAIKLIDFAHASWTPGLGPDENILRGIRSVIEILDKVLKELS